MLIGIVFGVAIGLGMKNMMIGVALGQSLGVVFAETLARAPRSDGDSRRSGARTRLKGEVQSSCLCRNVRTSASSSAEIAWSSSAYTRPDSSV